MRGYILAVPEANAPGAISGNDGQRYRFSSADLNSNSTRAGNAVDFIVVDGEAREIYPVPGQASVFSPAFNKAIRQRDLVSILIQMAASDVVTIGPLDF